jgi:hypothetical protein
LTNRDDGVKLHSELQIVAAQLLSSEVRALVAWINHCVGLGGYLARLHHDDSTFASIERT